jgi:hypothetical protein
MGRIFIAVNLFTGTKEFGSDAPKNDRFARNRAAAQNPRSAAPSINYFQPNVNELSRVLKAIMFQK